jgi:predicted RecA/RadA family phage recombinase
MPDKTRCRIEDCHVLKHIVPSPGVSEVDMGLLGGSTVYYWLEDYETGVLGVKVLEAERVFLPKESASAFHEGDEVFYDDSTNTLQETSAGRYRVGKALADAAALTTEVFVDFHGNHALVV